jgi:hypothetical protein
MVTSVSIQKSCADLAKGTIPKRLTKVAMSSINQWLSMQHHWKRVVCLLTFTSPVHLEKIKAKLTSLSFFFKKKIIIKTLPITYTASKVSMPA